MNALLLKLKGLCTRVYAWFKDKLGRLLMSAGAFVASVDGFDIGGIKGELVKLLGEGRVAYLTIGLFIAGFWRSQHVAKKYNQLMKDHEELKAKLQ